MSNVDHADYPHEPGTLYDCEACETECFCWELNHNLDGSWRWAHPVDSILCIACVLDAEMP